MECKRCGKEFASKQSLQRHLLKETECPALAAFSRETLLSELNQKKTKESLYNCKKCGKVFNTRQSKYKHETYHCSNEATNSVLIERVKTLEERVRRFEITSSIASSSTTQNYNIENLTNNSITINLNNFGQKSLHHINEQFLTTCLFSCNAGIRNLMKEIHFNPDIPQNHNIRLLSKKQNTLEKFSDGSWHPCDKNNTLDDMIRKGYRILFRHLDNQPTENCDEDTLRRNEYVNNYLSKIMRRDSNIYYELRRDLYMMILDGDLYIIGR